MTAMASQIASLMIVYSSVYSGADQRKHQSCASLAFVRGIHRGPVNFQHKGPVTRKMFQFDDVIMIIQNSSAFDRMHKNVFSSLNHYPRTKHKNIPHRCDHHCIVLAYFVWKLKWTNLIHITCTHLGSVLWLYSVKQDASGGEIGCIYKTNHTVGSLNADILRYNADNLSITLKLWGKLGENVSWVNTFPSHSPISLHFTRQNIAYRVTTVSMFVTALMLSTHIVLSRGNGCHWYCEVSASFEETFDFSRVKQCPWRIFVPIAICFHFCVYRTYSIVFILLQELIFCCRWARHWKCEVRFSLSLSFALSLAFVCGIHRWSVNSPHKWPITRKMFPFDDVIMAHVAISIAPGVISIIISIPLLNSRMYILFGPAKFMPDDHGLCTSGCSGDLSVLSRTGESIAASDFEEQEVRDFIMGKFLIAFSMQQYDTF